MHSDVLRNNNLWPEQENGCYLIMYMISFFSSIFLKRLRILQFKDHSGYKISVVDPDPYCGMWFFRPWICIHIVIVLKLKYWNRNRLRIVIHNLESTSTITRYKNSNIDNTVCPRSPYPIHVVTHYIHWVETSWPYCKSWSVAIIFEESLVDSSSITISWLPITR